MFNITITRLQYMTATVCAAIILTACGTPAVIKKVEDKTVEALDIKASANSKPIQLSKIVVRLKRGQHIGAVQAGLLCVPHGDLSWKGGRLNIDSDEFTDAFKDELEKYSFKTVGDTSALFEDPSTWKSEILVAGLIKDLRANICFPFAGFGNFTTSKGEAFVKVEWQVYSKLDRAVVHSVTSEGSAVIPESMGDGGETTVIDAFAQAARNLLADEKFREIVQRGGEAVSETTFKDSSGLIVTPGKAQPLGKNAQEWSDGVVTVYAGSGHGSGFAIGENAIITNHHVIGGADKVVVKFGSGFEVTGNVVAYNSSQDVAAIKIDASLPKYFKTQRILPAVGSDVFAVGSPLSDKYSSTVTKGIVSAYREQAGNRRFIQADVSVRPGNSGGPLLNVDGEVIGVAVSGLQINGAGQGINFFVPIGDALSAMNIK